MPRPQKPSIPVNIRMDKEVHAALSAHCEKTAETKTDVVNRAVAKEVGMKGAVK